MVLSDAKDYELGVHEDPLALDAQAWNALLAQQTQPTLFMRHEWLAAMHRHGCAVPKTGWKPRFITLTQGGELKAAAALYMKLHSYGEYVFDWAWADAYRRHGLRYYPKLLSASPFSPVPGTRLLAQSQSWRERLAAAVHTWAQEQPVSSAHCLFLDEQDAQALAKQGWMLRHGVQFHWQAPQQECASAAPNDFAQFLSQLTRDKRKKIAQERRKVVEQGVTFEAFVGPQIDAQLWAFFHHCYSLTYMAHGNPPYLSLPFFEDVGRSLASHWLMFVANQGGERVACSLIALEPERRTAYGRYWGCVRSIDCLHFEACYYQPLAWCMANGYTRFEGGAQGEHKMARGLMPVPTSSAHWLRDERFANAVAEFLAAEGGHIDRYVSELHERSPFKAPTAAAKA